MKHAKVYGPGWKRRAATVDMVKAAAGAPGVEVDIEKAVNPREIAIYGKPVHIGGLPGAARLTGGVQA